MKNIIRKVSSAISRRIFKQRILHLELTSRCNLLCKACYRSGDLKKYMNLNDFMPLEKLEILLEKYSSNKVSSVVLSGGENLLHPDFFGCLAAIRKRFPKKDIILSTNGIVLSKFELLDKICKSELNHLQISLHGATQKTIDKLQKGINLEKVLESIKFIKKNSDIKLNANYVIQEENISEMLAFVKLISNAGIYSITFTPMNFAGYTEKEINYAALWKKLHLKEELIKVREQAHQLKVNIPDFVPCCTSVHDVDVLTVTGDVLPCWGNYLVQKYSIGNIFSEDPEKIRHKKEFKALLKALDEKDTHKMCISCWANGKYSL